MRAALFVVFAQSSSCHHHARIVDAARRGPRAAGGILAALTSGMSKSDAKLLAFAAELRDAAVGLQTAVDAARGMDHVSLPADGAVSASDVVDYAAHLVHHVRARGVRAGRASGRHHPRAAGRHFAASHLARHHARVEAREKARVAEAAVAEEARKKSTAGRCRRWRGHRLLSTWKPAAVAGGLPPPQAGSRATRCRSARTRARATARRRLRRVKAVGGTSARARAAAGKPRKVVPFVQLDLNPDMDDASDEFESERPGRARTRRTVLMEVRWRFE